MEQIILSNAHIVGPEEHFDGTLVIENGYITDVIKEKNYSEGINMQQRWLIPGIIDIHSDYLERELHPRRGADFPVPLAMHYVDARAASCGITTLFNAISFSEHEDKSRTFEQAVTLANAIENALPSSLIKHFIHARLDPNTHAVLDYIDHLNALKTLTLVVYNDSIPGQRQYPLDHLISYLVSSAGITREKALEEVNITVQQRSAINHREPIQKGLRPDIILGSHDDTTIEHVDEAFYYGATLAEMPTTIEAARRAKEIGMMVCMGAPNYYRGGSHCGNLSCVTALNEGLVDILCSDYHFPTMLASLVKMLDSGINPSVAVNLMTKNPADYMQMKDVGTLEAGKKADLFSFTLRNGYAAVHDLMVDGQWKFNATYEVSHTAHDTDSQPSSRHTPLS
jgi:alpha-D-ribose 1-methylphosphonate 5-triphosphate diphosphatase